MIKAALIYNGIEGLDQLYKNDDRINYEWLEVTKDFRPDLTAYDVLIVPNGSDHIALYRMKDIVLDFLNQGKTLLCFDGWFTDWVPGSKWIMDNEMKSIDLRYRIHSDSHGLGEHFNIEDLNYSHGISGWWSCGYIDAAPGAEVFMVDSWNRPLVIIDEKTTNGLIICTASGPAADLSYATTDDAKAYDAMTKLYRAFIQIIEKRLITA